MNTILPASLVQCYAMALPAGCNSNVPIPGLGNLMDEYDFVVTVVVNNNTGPVDELENYFVFAVNGVPQKNLNVTVGQNYTFYAHISCGDSLIITDQLDPAYPVSIDGQYACLHQNPLLTLVVDENSPSILYYDSVLHPTMGGNITVLKAPAPPGPVIPPPPSPESMNTPPSVIGLGAALGVVIFVLVLTVFYFLKIRKPGYTELTR